MENEKCIECQYYNNGWCNFLRTKTNLILDCTKGVYYSEQHTTKDMYPDLKSTLLYAKLYQCGKKDFKSFEEQEQFIKILVELCESQNDIIIELRNIIKESINKKYGKR